MRVRIDSGWPRRCLTSPLLVLAVLLGIQVAVVPPIVAADAETSCLACHADAEMMDDEDLLKIATDWKESVHAAVGVSCHDCHGGNPSPEFADDMDAAMDPEFAEAPFTDLPDAQRIPAFCGRCHSDPDYMKRFRPDARVDQEQEYHSSQHGKSLSDGNKKVATCISCHGDHGILRADNPRSSVYPTRVAETCGGCHADPEWMAGETLEDGRPMPVDQVGEWHQSVHAHALLERGDLFAPTCNDCHGNHGAAPPGYESVSFVCGQCHGREAELFRASSKHDGYLEHREFLEDAEGEGCAACHETPDPAAELPAWTSLGECTACHLNHAIIRPTTAMLAPLPETPCAHCHLDDHEEVVEASVQEPTRSLEKFKTQQDDLLAEAETLGLTGESRYDWLVDQALELPYHTDIVTEDGQDRAVPRPEFGRLFEKLRIGKIHHTFTNPSTGEAGVIRIRRCSDCHASEPELADDPVGLTVGSEIFRHLRILTGLTSRAERMLLTARRGGVEIGHAQEELDQAIDAQIQLQALVHGFSIDEDGPFVETSIEGIEHAEAALVASDSALEELGVRRQGMFISLGFILLVMVGLALLIRRRASAEEREAA